MSETTESEVLRTPLAQEKLYQVNLGSGAFSMPGYVRVDIDPSQKPDLVMDIRKLDFKDASVDVIYASHVLEHICDESSTQTRWEYLVQVLRDWRRCLKPEGRLFVCVPHLENLAQLIVQYQDVLDIQKTAIDSIFGGARTKYDFHYAGFTHLVLKHLLHEAGFQSVETFESFVPDESSHQLANLSASLNLMASNGKSDAAVFVKPARVEQKQSEEESYRRISEERFLEIVGLKRECNAKDQEIEIKDKEIADKHRELMIHCDALEEIRGRMKFRTAELGQLRELLAHERSLRTRAAKKRTLFSWFSK